MARANVVALHSFTDDEALMWLSDHVDGRVETSLGDLARQFGWPLLRLRRQLAGWVEAGLITQSTGGRGKVVLAPTRTPRETATQLLGHAFAAPVGSAALEQKPRSAVALISAGLLLLTALGLTAVGLI